MVLPDGSYYFEDCGFNGKNLQSTLSLKVAMNFGGRNFSERIKVKIFK